MVTQMPSTIEEGTGLRLVRQPREAVTVGRVTIHPGCKQRSFSYNKKVIPIEMHRKCNTRDCPANTQHSMSIVDASCRTSESSLSDVIWSGDMCRFLLDEISLRMCISVSSYYEEMGLCRLHNP